MLAREKRTSSSSPLLAVRNLAVRAAIGGRTVLGIEHLELARGEILGVVGPPGAGKSTLALAVAGMLPPGLRLAAGDVQLGEMQLLALPERELRRIRGSQIGLIFQSPDEALDQLRSCRVQLEEPLRAHRDLSAVEREDRLLTALSSLGFADPARILASRPAHLSGGERQRVLMALATLLEPELLIADEPTSGLDPDLQQDFVDWLRTNSNGGRSTILISHQWDLVHRACDTIVRIEDGRLVPTAPPIALPACRPASNRRLGPPLLCAKGIGVQISGSEVVADVSLELRRGEALGVIGPSGAGKTTLARALAGLVPLVRGSVDPDPAARRRGQPSPVQLVFQDPATSLNPRLSIGEAVAEAALARGTEPAAALEEARGWIARVGLDAELLDRLPETLSGGQKQLVAIARALASEPSVIIADEPSASLGPEAALQLVAVLGKLIQQGEVALLLISHDRELVAALCERVLVMDDGRVVASGPAVELLDSNPVPVRPVSDPGGLGATAPAAPSAERGR